VLAGRIIAESLAIGVALDVPSLRLTRVLREDVAGSSSPRQPDVFTLLDVEADDEHADALAEALAAALVEGPGWYADFRVGADRVVVFPRCVFRYPVGDAAGRLAAVEHGRTLGIPEPQLDWGD
jgi:hypothetical protein